MQLEWQNQFKREREKDFTISNDPCGSPRIAQTLTVHGSN